MNMVIKHKVLRAHLKDWLACKGDKEKRGALSKQLASTVKLHPKSIWRSMKRLQLKRKDDKGKKRGRRLYYDKAVDAAIYEIWVAMGKPCAEIMLPAIPEFIKAFVKEGCWKHSDITTEKLKAISMGTLKNRVASMREKYDRVRGKSSTASSPLKSIIPIRKSHTWHCLPPGYLQLDTVVHCGDILTDNVVYSLGSVDFRTYWIEYTAQWNKGKEATWESFEVIEERSPIRTIEAHPDTGNEFINYHFHELIKERGIDLSRSEPNKKNDNMCIEERNGNIARRYLGYDRMDNPDMVSVAGEVLRLACLFHNHFIPVRRMVDKVRINGKWKRTYEDKAKTAYTRFMEHPDIPSKDKAKLQNMHNSLNPLAIKRELDAIRKKLSKMIRRSNYRV